MPVAVALAADRMVEVEKELRKWLVVSAQGSHGGCQHVWKSRPWLNRVRCGVVERGGVLERELLGVPQWGT